MNFRPDTMQSKLILLYVLDKIEIAVTENTIMDICWSRNNWLNYMEIVDIMPQLIEMNFITKSKDADGEPRFCITDLGRNCLSNFYSQVDEKLRTEITEFCKSNRMELKRAQEYVSNFVKVNDDCYLASFKIKDMAENTVDIKIKFNNRNQAQEACKNWKKNAPFIYANLYENLNDKDIAK